MMVVLITLLGVEFAVKDGFDHGGLTGVGELEAIGIISRLHIERINGCKLWEQENPPTHISKSKF